VRAALFDHSGRLIPKTLVKNKRQIRHTAGGAEIDADAALRQLLKVIDETLSAAAHITGEITHFAQSCFWHSLVGVDSNGNPTTKVLTWADNRSSDECSLLRKRFDETEVHNRTGARFHSSFWPAKLLSIKAAEAEAYERTDKWLSLSDYIALKLSGEASTSVSMASATGMFDIHKCRWDAPLVRFLRLEASTLPEIADKNRTFRLNKKFARRWPRLAGAEWFPAIGDGAANNIGSGSVGKSRAALMVGTSGAMRVAYRGEPPSKIPDGLWCYRIDDERVIVGGALSDGGGLIEWLQQNLRLPVNFESLIARRQPTAHGLTFLPFLAGERSTGYHEDARGAIIGLTSTTDTVDIAQASMESVAYRFAEIFDQLVKIVDPIQIIASGGALRASRVWTQIIADVLGRELKLIDVPEASLHGAVLLALETIGNIESIENIESVSGRLCVPDLDKHEIFKSARKRHQDFYRTVVGKN
jgi:gluconokinase